MVAKLKVNTIETVNGDGSITFNNPVNAQFPGKVLQTIEMVPAGTSHPNTQVSTTSYSYINTGYYIDITPTYTNSIIRITASFTNYNNGTYSGWTIYRGTPTTFNQVNLADPLLEASNNGEFGRGLAFAHNATHYNQICLDVTDQPNTLNLVRYTIGMASYSSSYYSYLGWGGGYYGQSKNAINMIVQEIGQ